MTQASPLQAARIRRLGCRLSYARLQFSNNEGSVGSRAAQNAVELRQTRIILAKMGSETVMSWRGFWRLSGFIVCLVLYLAARPSSADEDLDHLIDPYVPAVDIFDMINKVNALRQSKGLAPLAINEELSAAAQEQADYISRTGNYAHEHNGSTPGTRAIAAGYQTTEWCCSENTHRSRIGKSAWEFWNFSPPHYRNMINPAWTEIGAAISNVDEWTGWVLVFGSGIQMDGLVPAEPETLIAAAPESPSNETYTVQYGDSLGLIAERYEVPIEALVAANDIEAGSFIVPGDVLIIPR